MNPTMNRLIPIIGGVLLLIAVGVGLQTYTDDAPPAAKMTEVPETPAPDADTPADTVRTLSAQVAELLEHSKTLSEDNQALREQNEQLIAQRERVRERVSEQVRQELDSAEQGESDMISALTSRMDRLRERLLTEKGAGSGPDGGGEGDMPVGFGYDAQAGRGGDAMAMHWIEPLDASGAGGEGAGNSGGFAVADAAGSLDSLLRPGASTGEGTTGETAPGEAASQTATPEQPQEAERPVYTIPPNATLIGSTAFSALVGRIPIGGQVQDPMPFKALIGAPNLAANGVEVPGLEGMVVSGYAVGDWTLGCVRGNVTSATFVFQDGRIVAFGDNEPQGGGQKQSGEERIGWISDRLGVPCVSGERITNAPSFLAQRMGVTALQAAAEAAAASQTTSVVSDEGTGTSTVTGDTGKYVLGKTASGGVEEISQWLLERQAQSFDAVFVPAGTSIVVHVDEQLPIDYDPKARLTDYRLDDTGGGHGPLD